VVSEVRPQARPGQPPGRAGSTATSRLQGSKLGEVLFTTELARRIKGSGVTVRVGQPRSRPDELRRTAGVLGVVLGVMQHTPMFNPPAGRRGNRLGRDAPSSAGDSGGLYMRGKQLSPGRGGLPVTGRPGMAHREAADGIDPARSPSRPSQRRRTGWLISRTVRFGSRPGIGSLSRRGGWSVSRQRGNRQGRALR